MPRVIHFEIPAANGPQAVEFYKEVFGWDATQWGDAEYWLINTGDEREPGINGAITKPDQFHQGIVNTVGVADIDMAEKAIIQFGGTIIMPKSPIPTVGYVLYFKDPAGNVLGAMQSDPK